MTRPARAAFRGEVTAAAYLLDPATLGEDATRDRVLRRWTAGTRLLAWPGGRWLLVLGTAETGPAERAPGLPLVGGPDGLTTPGEPVVPGAVHVPRGDDALTVPLAHLHPVDTAAWFAADDLVEVVLTPVERELRVDVPDEPVARDELHLREFAGVGAPTSAATAFVTDVERRSRIGVVLAVLAAVVVLVAVVGTVVVLVGGGGSRPPRAVPTPRPTAATSPTVIPGVVEVPLGSLTLTLDATGGVLGVPGPVSTSDSEASARTFLVPVLAVLVLGGLTRVLRRRPAGAASARRRRSGRTRPPRRQRWREALTRVVLGSPAGGVIGRRHARYLRDLGDDLEHGRWDTALPAAIALGGDGAGGVLSMRLPRRRDALTLTGPTGVGAAVPYGPQVEQFLRDLYRQAAERLEREGRTAKAAYVLAVLLHDPAAAVALLERAGDPALAAEVAEVRDLDPSLVVRLWWQAGDRARAVRIARSRGAFAAAVVRLERVDAGLAHELRTAWVAAARAAGDAVTAVEAAWPDPELRRHAPPDVRAGLETGGPAAGRMLVRFLSGGWAAGPMERVSVDLVSASTPVEASLRRGFLAALAEGPVAAARLDRQLCSAAALVTLRDPQATAGVPVREAMAMVTALRRRADPLLAADLPSWSAPTLPDGPLTVDLTGPPGVVPVHDAVVLPDGSTLLSLGELGLRWVTTAGHLRAQWSLPVHAVTLADHGRSALLVRDAGGRSEVHRLDLTDRRLRYWATLRVQAVADSFDGGTVATVDDDGIAVLDTTADRPRVLWRELSASQPVLAWSRTPTRLTAVSLAPLPPGGARPGGARPGGARPGGASGGSSGRRPFELFDWELPSMTLRLRRQFVPLAELSALLVNPGAAVQVGRAVLGAQGLTHLRDWSDPRFVPLPPEHRVLATADTLATIAPVDPVDAAAPGDPGGFVATVTVGRETTVTVRGHGPVEDVRVHRHGDLLTVSDGRGGRVVGVDTGRGEIVTRVRTDV